MSPNFYNEQEIIYAYDSNTIDSVDKNRVFEQFYTDNLVELDVIIQLNNLRPLHLLLWMNRSLISITMSMDNEVSIELRLQSSCSLLHENDRFHHELV